MSYDEISQVGFKAKEKGYNDLIKKTLECFGVDFDDVYYDNSMRPLSGRFDPDIEGEGILEDKSTVFSLLNRLFGKVRLYTEYEYYGSAGGDHLRSEYVYDPEKMMCYNFEVHYSYSNGSAFGVYIPHYYDECYEYDEDDEDDDLLESYGTISRERKLKLKTVTQDVKDKLIEESTKRGYTELTAIILQKLTIDEVFTDDKDEFDKELTVEPIEDGVLMLWKSDVEKVVIPSDVKKIGKHVFAKKSIKEVVIPEGVTEIGEYAFAGCEDLKKVVLPGSILKVGKKAFVDTPWLESIKENNTLAIAGSVLIDGTSASGSIIIPETVTVIADHAFGRCKELEDITIPDSVTEIGSSAFRHCNDLTIHAPAGSYAEKFAEEYGIEFEAL